LRIFLERVPLLFRFVSLRKLLPPACDALFATFCFASIPFFILFYYDEHSQRSSPIFAFSMEDWPLVLLGVGNFSHGLDRGLTDFPPSVRALCFLRVYNIRVHFLGAFYRLQAVQRALPFRSFSPGLRRRKLGFSGPFPLVSLILFLFKNAQAFVVVRGFPLSVLLPRTYCVLIVRRRTPPPRQPKRPPKLTPPTAPRGVILRARRWP